MTDAKKELADFEKDHAIEVATKELEAVEKLQQQELEDAEKRAEDSLNAKIEAIDAKLEDKNGIYNKALSDVQNGGKNLYKKMVAYNNVEGSGNPEDIATMWNEAYTSMINYYKLFGEYYKDIHLRYGKNLNPSPVAEVANIDAVPLIIDAIVNNKVTAADLKKIKTAISNSKSTQSAVVKGKYAAGTRSASRGLHEINERGDEALFKTSDGRTFRLFSGGEHVFNNVATDFLYNFANAPDKMLSQILSSGNVSNIRGAGIPQNISLGDIYINGNTNDRTISEIRREKRAEMDYLLKELNRLNK